MLSKLPEFIGLDTRYPLATGNMAGMVHLDAAASPLPLQASQEAVREFLPYYANTHSMAHLSAKVSTAAVEWAYEKILEFVGARDSRHAVVATGTGATLPINRVARGLCKLRPDRDVTLISAMEHHANDLPHRYYGNKVRFFPLTGSEARSGPVDLEMLEKLLQQYEGRVNYIALSAVSNVTGIVNPVHSVARLAHQYDALLVVDGAQQVAHMPVKLARDDQLEEPDFYVFSGHKVYTPGAPGILIAKKELLYTLPQPDLGGGMVEDVSFENFDILPDFPSREQAGTPNIVGLIALAVSLATLEKLGLEEVSAHSRELTRYLLDGLARMDDVTIYGNPDAERVGATAFNISGVDHGLVAAILSDYYAVAVRNECFCAHPYVREMLKQELWETDIDHIPLKEQERYINLKRGMVRASIGLYNTTSDIDTLLKALEKIQRRIDKLAREYDAMDDGSYLHRTFRPDWRDLFDPEMFI